jgi:hypothetical protein
MSKFDELWSQAHANPGKPIDLGDLVVCDGCTQDHTNSEAKGGMIFGSHAYCPVCTDLMMQSVRRHNEQRFIKATCPPEMLFGDFVRRYRIERGTNHITVHTRAPG